VLIFVERGPPRSGLQSLAVNSGLCPRGRLCVSCKLSSEAGAVATAMIDRGNL